MHAHQGEDIGVLQLTRIAAHRLAVPLVITLHTSVRHTLRPAARDRRPSGRSVGG